MSAAALEGDLRHFQPTDVLQLLQLAQATGRLVLTRAGTRPGGERIEIHFEGGRPVSVRTNAPAVRTGEVLVHRGQLDPAVLETALEAQRQGPRRRLGALLGERGLVERPQLAAAVHETMRRVLYGMLLWREGRFSFQAGERLEDEDLPLELDLDRVILEGLRLADQARAAG